MNHKNIHDRYFRKVFADTNRMAAFLQLSAKHNKSLAEFLSLVDLSTLKEISETALDGENMPGSADLAFLVDLKTNENKNSTKRKQLLVGIIAEHKSYKDSEVLEQLTRYWYSIMNKKWMNIPTVAIIVYNGAEKWNPLEKPLFKDYPAYFHKIGLPFIVEFYPRS